MRTYIICTVRVVVALAAFAFAAWADTVRRVEPAHPAKAIVNEGGAAPASEAQKCVGIDCVDVQMTGPKFGGLAHAPTERRARPEENSALGVLLRPTSAVTVMIIAALQRTLLETTPITGVAADESPLPEPRTYALFCSGLLLLAIARNRLRKP